MLGLFLITILISSLFSAYAQMIRFDTKMERTRALILERQYLASRLQNVFLSGKEGSFYSKLFPEEKKESLVMIFDNGIDPNPAFSGHVLGRIFLNSQHQLILATWPLEKESKKRIWRKEILFTQVEDFRFHFLDPQKEEVEWIDRLPKERGLFPSMIRFFVKQQKEPLLSYAFFLPPNSYITYKPS